MAQVIKMKTIEGFPDYRILSNGTVFSIDRDYVNSDGDKRHQSGRLLKINYIRDYSQVRLFKNKKGKTFYVHRLVGLAFIPNPENKPDINHIDGNKSNNDIRNLEWSTELENVIHARDILHVGSSKKVVQLKEGSVIKVWNSTMEAEREGGFCNTHISSCALNKSKNHKNYQWKYL